MRLRWLLFSLGLALLLVLSDVYILAHDLFWHLLWLDTPMHILGGLVLGSFLAPLIGNRPRLYVILLTILFVSWEIFEYFYNIPQQHKDYRLDTFHDIVNDFIGAGFAYVLAKETLWRSK